MFILLNTRARVVKSDRRGREVILESLTVGDRIGEMSLIENESYSATVHAEVPTDMLMPRRAEFARCLPEDTLMAYIHLAQLGQTLALHGPQN